MNISNTIAAILGRISLALNNATATIAVSDQLAVLGYDEARIAEGKTLYQAAITAKDHYDTTINNQKLITNTLIKDSKETKELYMSHVKLARIVITDLTGGKDLLGLKGRRPESFHDWTRQALEFYDRAIKTPKILAMFSNFNLSEIQLQEGYDMVCALIQLNEEQEKAKATSHQAKTEKDLALKSLKKWHAALVKVARIALKDKPAMLEALGVNYNTTGPKKKPADESPTPPDADPPVDPTPDPDPDPPAEPTPEPTPPAPEAELKDGRTGTNPSSEKITEGTDLDKPKSGKNKKTNKSKTSAPPPAANN